MPLVLLGYDREQPVPCWANNHLLPVTERLQASSYISVFVTIDPPLRVVSALRFAVLLCFSDSFFPPVAAHDDLGRQSRGRKAAQLWALLGRAGGQEAPRTCRQVHGPRYQRRLCFHHALCASTAAPCIRR